MQSECRCAMCAALKSGALRPARIHEYGLSKLIGDRKPPAGVLDACLSLFDGHPVPALFSHYGTHWHPAPEATRELAFRAHLVGAARAGSYPLRGSGCRYMCMDLDDKQGAEDMRVMTGAAVSVCLQLGMHPIPFVSKSGRGVHVYLFFDGSVLVETANSLGKVIRSAIGANGRCDIMPSAGRPKGYGTLHALPMHPSDITRGGGVMLDRHLRPVSDVRAALERADGERTPARIVRALASSPGLVHEVAPRATGAPVCVPKQRPGRKPPSAQTGEQAARDRAIFQRMRKRHPQFRWAVASPSAAWRGKRSGRDTHLARQMARQGMSAPGIAEALKDIPGTKASVRREEDYASALAAWEGPMPSEVPTLPGTPTCEDGDGPWARRAAPPRFYDGLPNPWWEPDVQVRLRKVRAKATGAVLAFLIGFWFWGRGMHEQRMFYLGRREIAELTGFSERSVRSAIVAIERDFSDVVRVVRGIPHPSLRLATAFDVPCFGGKDQTAWHDDERLTDERHMRIFVQQGGARASRVVGIDAGNPDRRSGNGSGGELSAARPHAAEGRAYELQASALLDSDGGVDASSPRVRFDAGRQVDVGCVGDAGHGLQDSSLPATNRL